MEKPNINQIIRDLAQEVFGDNNFTIDDFDLDRVWITRNDDEYTIRTWNITRSKIDWTLFKTINHGNGINHGEMQKEGLFNIKRGIRK